MERVRKRWADLNAPSTAQVYRVIEKDLGRNGSGVVLMKLVKLLLTLLDKMDTMCKTTSPVLL